MYKGAGAFTGNFENMNEWCEFDPQAARVIAKFNLAKLMINIFVIILIIQIVLCIIFSWLLSIIISVLISVIIGYIYWNYQLKRISQYTESYSINVKIDRETIEKNVDSISQALLKMDILYGYNQTVKNDRAFRSKYTRNDNSHILLWCNGILNEDIKYCIFTPEFNSKDDVKSIRDMIWKEE